MRIATALLSFLLVGGCATGKSATTNFYQIEAGGLPPPDITLNIPGLTPCTDNPDHGLHLQLGQPVNVLVHGCFGSSGQFRGLAQVLAFHGQQAVCFSYDDRARLNDSATQLRSAIDRLIVQTQARAITVIGHSQGALIAHRSVTELALEPASGSADFRLVTISGPFNGIGAARTCGKTWLYPLTLGLLPLSCYAVTGAKWTDITNSSRFIRTPNSLMPQVSSFLKIDTDERGTCRRHQGNRCTESDNIFSLSEQRNPAIEDDRRAKRVQIQAGHVEIVGDDRVAPTKLISILQENGVILPTKLDHVSAFNQLLVRIYQDDSLQTPDVF